MYLDGAAMKSRAGRSQVDACYHALRGLIVTCELEPGSRVNERALIERLGYGRTPVREALLRLDQDRLIDTLPRSGYRIRPFTRKSIDDFFRVWRLIGPLIARLAAERLTAKQRTELAKILEEARAFDLTDSAGHAELAGRFFGILVEAANNDPLAFIFRRLGAEMERLFVSFFRTPQGRDWLTASREISIFTRPVDPEMAAKRIEARIIACERSILTQLDPDIDDDAPQSLADVERAA